MASAEPVAVSVIMPVYNSAEYLPDSIGSVFAQTYRDYQIVLVDDGSPDDSADVIADIIDRHPDQDISYVRQENKGIAGARNTGIRRAAGKYIALLDPDDVWKPTRLEDQVAVLDTQPDVGLVHARHDRIDADGQPLAAARYGIDVARQSGHIYQDLLLRRAHVAANTALFRRECCDRVGLFNESRVMMGVDDRDLWVRIAREYRVVFIDKTLASWRRHDKNYSANSESMTKGRLAMLDGLYQQQSIGSVLYRKATSVVLKEMGDVYLLNGDFSSARAQYFHSVRRWPLQIGGVWNGLKALVRFRPERYV